MLFTNGIKLELNPFLFVSPSLGTDICKAGVGYSGNDGKSKENVTDVDSCKTFCTEQPNPTPYFGWLESTSKCFCKTQEDPAARVEVNGGYVSGTVTCVMPGGEE